MNLPCSIFVWLTLIASTEVFKAISVSKFLLLALNADTSTIILAVNGVNAIYCLTSDYDFFKVSENLYPYVTVTKRLT